MDNKQSFDSKYLDQILILVVKLVLDFWSNMWYYIRVPKGNRKNCQTRHKNQKEVPYEDFYRENPVPLL